MVKLEIFRHTVERVNLDLAASCSYIIIYVLDLTSNILPFTLQCKLRKSSGYQIWRSSDQASPGQSRTKIGHSFAGFSLWTVHPRAIVATIDQVASTQHTRFYTTVVVPVENAYFCHEEMRKSSTGISHGLGHGWCGHLRLEWGNIVVVRLMAIRWSESKEFNNWYRNKTRVPAYWDLELIQ